MKNINSITLMFPFLLILLASTSQAATFTIKAANWHSYSNWTYEVQLTYRNSVAVGYESPIKTIMLGHGSDYLNFRNWSEHTIKTLYFSDGVTHSISLESLSFKRNNKTKICNLTNVDNFQRLSEDATIKLRPGQHYLHYKMISQEGTVENAILCNGQANYPVDYDILDEDTTDTSSSNNSYIFDDSFSESSSTHEWHSSDSSYYDDIIYD